MALTQLMAFVNGGILIVSFALLLIVLSYNVSNIDSVAVFANAKSVAAALGTRVITSPNCFAYRLNMDYYNNNSAVVGGPLYAVSDTEPGVIDANKFSAGGFISCIQYVYFGGASDIPGLPSMLAAFTGISVTLKDTQNPSDLGASGAITLSNYNQLNYGNNFYKLETQVQQYAQYAEYAALVASMGASVALGTLSGGMVGLNIVVAVGSNSHNDILPQYSAVATLLSENSYTEQFPVAIQFTNQLGQPLYQDSGVLSITINYGLST